MMPLQLKKGVKLEPLVWLRTFVDWFKSLPRPQQLAWGAIALGIVLIIVGLAI